MYIEQATIFIITVIVLSCFLWYHKRPKNFPPGPRGLPIVGNLLFIKGDLHKYLTDLSQKYGGLFSIQMGHTPVVVLNDWKSIKEALLTKSALFSGRPPMFVFQSTLKNKDLVTTTATTWKEQKRFTLHHLRDFGFGKKSMEEVILTEVTNTLHFLENNVNTEHVHITELFFSPILSVLTKIIAGNAFEINSAAMTEMSQAMQFNFKCFQNGSVLNFMPYLRFIPGATDFKKFMKTHKQVEDIIKEQTENHIKTYKEGEPRDFSDVYLTEIFKKDEKKNVIFQKDYMNGVIYDLYNAGVETMESTLSFSLMYMALWPEIQQKIQKEIDEVIGHGRFPSYSDSNLLQYCNATMLEVHRYTSVAPLSVPHAPIEDAELMDYTIPKKTFMLENIWAVHNDKDLWGDPENFRPERFLDSEGKVQNPEYLIPFSLGARLCLGVPLAKMEFFLFLTCLLQRYSFHCITGEKPPDMKPIVGITQRPQPFHLTVKKRY